MKKFLAMALAASTLTACNTSSSNQTASEEAASAPKALILCYSQTGTTKTVAEEIQKQTGADIEYIECAEAYDGDFGATIQRWQQEMKDGKLPEIKEVKANPTNYDVIFLGYPIWGGNYASPMASYLKTQTLEGKKVVPFMTFGSGGNTSISNLKAALPKAEIAKYFGIRTARISAAPAEIKRFLIEQGYVKGEIAPLPAYSEMQAVSEAEAAVFNEACSGYQFPLGTPAEFGMRKTETSTDYVFKAKSQNPDGSEATSTIYVTVANGGKAEFTEVVR
ncbi:MAG: NAD(P)H-dependent oxidoreductase [Bacteroidales bacterium]|nr:NAD(P)H-dependent oxidoreductase [Bacteroidales bacterium]